MTGQSSAALDRRDVMRAIVAQRGDALMVTGLGSTTYDAGTVDHPNTFCLWGSMGAAAMMGLGLAIAQPNRRTLVMTGDGEMLMGVGALATIGAQRPRNLAIAVIDNEHYSETGMQATHTRRGVDLAAVAKACGFPVAETVRDNDELKAIVPRLFSHEGPFFVAIKVNTQRYPMSIRVRDGAHLKDRFRENLLGAERAYY
ncbi:aldehyde dehydrogenase [Mesorhizobium sp. M7A.F.Ca.US.006.01.1.1]|uniref:thiamine pyrophosphate-dependent enzyme n=1 Tax=Mesorhizobium sp. M7A.F.Ca.US.006.01.1.1 TaxID=2496707 RepID=UPI000FCAD4A9|nr:thiamine pyrophosphate-dependent enzyme [Mesorhizobium sp. M7A.F.Ca.US.006.01.1.1]RUZ71958.1 aldehyde dehydrogenase [Mesorhizobium sp. M7A.F.Ca.US.006.01.1.1]